MRHNLTVPDHALDRVFHIFDADPRAPAGLRRGKSLMAVSSAQIAEPVEQWCAENNIPVKAYFDFTVQRHHVVIYGDAEAMLFKLRWL